MTDIDYLAGGVLADWQIDAIFNPLYKSNEDALSSRQRYYREYLEDFNLELGNITPFHNEERKPNSTSTGLSCAGYDICIDSTVPIEVFHPPFNTIDSPRIVIDPLNFNSKVLTRIAAHRDELGRAYFLIPPNSYCLAASKERFKIPNWVIGIATGKSTYARAGCKLNITPLEPGWEGNLVVEYANHTPYELKVYADMGFAQIVFHTLGEPVDKCYSSKNGRYQNQEKGVVYSRA